tara:strand:- start:254 stop:478 length:225 start_codon:yes stop_codon:yes gene_type:complete
MAALRGGQLLKLNYMSKEKFKPKGLGDTVERFTKATGIKSFTNFLSSNGVFGKKGCGCDKRKEALNKAFPYKNK